MLDTKLATRLLFGTAALAALGFSALSVAVARGKTSRFDARAKRRVQSSRGGGGKALALRAVAKTTTPLGKWWGYLPASLATAGRLLRSGRTAGAITVASSAVGAALLPPLLERALGDRLAPPERGDGASHSYPSGHALQSSAVALATGYVLWREGMSSKSKLSPLGVASLAAGAGRLLLDRHWTTDVVGGYFAGIAWGAACAGAYELSRTRQLVI